MVLIKKRSKALVCEKFLSCIQKIKESIRKRERDLSFNNLIPGIYCQEKYHTLVVTISHSMHSNAFHGCRLFAKKQKTIFQSITWYYKILKEKNKFEINMFVYLIKFILASLLLLLLLLGLWSRRRMIILWRRWCLWRSLLWLLLRLWLLLLERNKLAHLWYFIEIDIWISWLRLFWHRNGCQIIKKIILIEFSSQVIIRVHAFCLFILLVLLLQLFLFGDDHIALFFFIN